MRRRPRSLLGLTLAAALTVGGCGDDEDRDSSAADPTVSAASSLSTAFPAYAESIGQDPKFSFAGSDELAAQIRSGAAPDVYAAANTTYPQELFDEGLVEQPVEFATNQLVIAVPKGSHINSVGDLAEPGLALAIGDPEVPVGSYTREVLKRLPASESSAILDNVGSEEPDVAGIVGKVTQGAVDAGFVYATDVRAAAEDVDAVELPAMLQPEVVYGIAVVTDAKQAEAAQEFVDGLTHPEGQRILEDAGFLPAP